ncbi:MAG TPA: lysophospholipid acyltransferase family protein [Chitinophagales bacterium]
MNTNFDFTLPSKTVAKQLFAPFKFYFDPQFFGLDELDASRPALYVSNHTVWGVLDGYPFGIELYLRKGILLRALTDSLHHKVPYWRELITQKMGMVEASRANCAELMKQGESILVFPGGTREICKKKGEKYELKWSDRTGFVRMAISQGYDIIPVAAVGAEEAFSIVKDANDFFDKNVFGKLLRKTGLSKNILKDGDLLPPAIKGIGGSIFPRPEKLYFSFGKRISTKRYKNKIEDPETLQFVKQKVELALLKQFKTLFEIREQDKKNIPLLRKLLTRKSEK